MKVEEIISQLIIAQSRYQSYEAILENIKRTQPHRYLAMAAQYKPKIAALLGQIARLQQQRVQAISKTDPATQKGPKKRYPAGQHPNDYKTFKTAMVGGRTTTVNGRKTRVGGSKVVTEMHR